MLKQLFRFRMDSESPDGTSLNGSTEQSMAAAVAEPLPRRYWDKTADEPSDLPALAVAASNFPSFDDIYRNGSTNPPRVNYDIRKVSEMMDSPHLAGMTLDAKRSSLLMALEAVGVQVNDLLHDAMERLRALNVYDDSQSKELRDFEAAKSKENGLIKAELDRLSAAYMIRIQANLDQVARKEDHFRRWSLLKQQEAEQIVETAMFCAPPGSSGGLGTLTGAFQRLGAEAAAGKR